MKSMQLFFRIIKASIKKNLAIYTVFLLFCTLTTVAIIYISGKYNSNILAKENYDEMLTTYLIDFGASDNASFSNVEQAVNEYSNNYNVKVIKLNFSNAKVQDDENNTIKPIYEMIAYPLNEKEMIWEYVKKAGLTEFDVTEFTSSDDAVIIVTDPMSDINFDTLTFNDMPYTVVDSVSYGKNKIKEHLASYKTVQKNKPMLREITIVFKEITNLNALNEITSGLKKSFPSATVTEPIDRDFSKESILSLGNMLMYLVMVLSVLNLIYNYRYILNERKYQYKILRLYGCTKNRISVFTALEILMICATQITAGVVLFEFVFKPIILQIEPTLKYNFDNGLYFAVSLFMAFMSVVMIASGIIYNKFIDKKGKR